MARRLANILAAVALAFAAIATLHGASQAAPVRGAEAAPNTRGGEGSEAQRAMLLGRWRVTTQWNDEAPSYFDIEFFADNRFTVTDAAGGRGEGAWRIDGSQVSWRYAGEENLNTAYVATLSDEKMHGTATADDNWRGRFAMAR